MQSQEELEAEWANQLPEWAIGRTNGELVLGAQLCTRDGRHIGNAHIIRIGPLPRGLLGTEYTILTDAGNVVHMTIGEVEEIFWPPKWISNVKEVVKKFGRQ